MLYRPAGHATQEEAFSLMPAATALPSGHCLHSVLPKESSKRPEGQTLHVSVSLTSLKRPAAQGVQSEMSALSAGETLPSGHRSHSVLRPTSPFEWRPVRHSLQVGSGSPAYFPRSQSAQVLPSAVSDWPAGHARKHDALSRAFGEPREENPATHALTTPSVVSTYVARGPDV